MDLFLDMPSFHLWTQQQISLLKKETHLFESFFFLKKTFRLQIVRGLEAQDRGRGRHSGLDLCPERQLLSP